MVLQTVGTPILWAGFTAGVIVLLLVDLLVFHRREHEVGHREAIAWSIGWVALALLFNLGVYRWFGYQRALEFFTGYLIELSLSVDNLFVFILILGAFAVAWALKQFTSRGEVRMLMMEESRSPIMAGMSLL